MLIAIALSAALQPCNATASASDVNRPIASATIANTQSFERVHRTVARFAEQNHFAMQPIISRAQGAVLFSMRLFRDDVSIILTQLRDEPLLVTAYPLCVCEIGRRLGLQEAADSSVTELRARLSR